MGHDDHPDRATPPYGLRALRRHHSCKLRFGELLIDCRYVLDPSTGSPVMPVPAQALAEHRSPTDDPDREVVLFVPDDAHEHAGEALQMLAIPEPLDPRTHEAGDRYLVYHGTPSERNWAIFSVQTVRWAGVVVSGEEVLKGNPFRSLEPRICKELNADRGVIAAACGRATGTTPEAPLVVGVDPDGVDVRARFGIVRVEFDRTAKDDRELSDSLASIGLRWQARAK